MNTLDNFLIRFFWPKEMRRLVDQYRTDGCLNEEAIAYFNKKALKYFLILEACSLIYLTTATGVMYKVGLIILFFAPLMAKIDLYTFFKWQMEPYATGTKVMAVSLGREQNLYGNQQVPFMLREDYSIKGRIKFKDRPCLKKEDILKSGELFPVYFVSTTRRAMPDLQYLKAKCSLTNTILEA